MGLRQWIKQGFSQQKSSYRFSQQHVRSIELLDDRTTPAIVVIEGTPDSDVITINLADYAAPDTTGVQINGLEGDDTIVVYGQAPVSEFRVRISGQNGNDTVIVRDDLYANGTSYVQVTVDLGEGDDRFEGTSANASVLAYVTGGEGRDYIATGAGDDWVTDSGAAGGNIITGSGTDLATIDGSGFVITTGSGSDSISGNLLDSWVFSEGGNDTISLAGSGNFIFAGNGNDRIRGERNGLSNSIIHGESERDDINIAGEGNTIYGGIGNDTITVTGKNNSVSGQGGNDSLLGRNGFNVLDGGTGNDTIAAENTSEALLIGGSGIDVFRAASTNARSILILDFSVRDDSLSGFGVSNTVNQSQRSVI